MTYLVEGAGGGSRPCAGSTIRVATLPSVMVAGCLPDIEALAPDDLKGLVLQLLEDVVALKAENAALREEIARLKGLKGPPKLKPSGMEKATEPARAERKAGRRGNNITH